MKKSGNEHEHEHEHEHENNSYFWQDQWEAFGGGNARDFW